MFDLNYQIQVHQTVCQERIQRALVKASRLHLRDTMPRASLYRRTLSQLGNKLVVVGTKLQTAGRHSPTPAQLDPFRRNI